MTRSTKQRATTGGYFMSRGKYFARVSIAPKQRRSILLATVTTDAEAERRSKAIADLVQALRDAGKPEYMETLLEQGSTLT